MTLLRHARTLLVAAGLLHAPAAMAAEEVAFPSLDWSFQGIFGTYDRANLQRGFQVYKEVCSACHSMDFVAFRNLEDLGYSPEEVKAIAAEFTVTDGPDDNGDMFTRPGKPADYFPSPFPNVQAAAAANGGAAPPDLSLVTKRHEAGANYPYAILTGYEEAPADFQVPSGKYYNHYFAGHAIGMAPPLFPDAVEYQDGTKATVQQMAYDVSNFLMWTAEPHMEARKQTGIKAILFLLVFTAILYAVKRKVWKDLH